jgi:MerR family transcriptional regulator, light-induced transcriptional regulator
MIGSWPGGYADVLLAGSPREARTAALGLLDQGVLPRTLYMEVLGPALREVGSRWQRGLISVAQEHLATSIVSSVMATVAPRLIEPPPIGLRAVLACTDGELHDVGLRMVGDFLEADGWEVLFLGALTPPDALQDLAAESEPDVVGLSTTLTTHLASAAGSIAAIRQLEAPPFIIVGGRAYGDDSSVAIGIGADVLVPDAGAASALLRERFAPTRRQRD